ncbi:hypothetical protein GXP71_13410 [Cellulomonas sp. H30R-01]|uniref:DUF5701 family protein n=1 Tax=Cellulomonas sp. H30R-01 TaxID=2704467 RepID=UPI00138D912E|nr:DUF5701 family protein [Cellulomonas sp. H30R-01]QHT56976.1 hypothetical protein GXP71_13410 [Cellulomonas sp. H30R-01]
MTATAPRPETSGPPALPPLAAQVERLVALGVLDAAGLDAARVHDAVQAVDAPGLLVVDRGLVPASVLTPLLRLGDRAGFVVEDMTDVDAFAPTDGLDVPPSPVYVVTAPDRGDDLGNWSPEEALPELAARGRSPLLLTEGLHWALQVPEVVERNFCYMTIGSRLRKADGAYDARTPAVWISLGTGRDGRERRGAPKVGWCWWRNRHTWLGFASGVDRLAVPLDG